MNHRSVGDHYGTIRNDGTILFLEAMVVAQESVDENRGLIDYVAKELVRTNKFDSYQFQMNTANYKKKFCSGKF